MMTAQDLSITLHGLRLRGESHAADIIEAATTENAVLLERLYEAYGVAAQGWRQATDLAATLRRVREASGE